jgi:hypothetical protein
MSSFIATQRGRRIRYDLDNRRLQRGALTYTTERFSAPTLVAGPITLTVHAAATTTETLTPRARPGPNLVSARRHRPAGRITSARVPLSSPWCRAR